MKSKGLSRVVTFLLFLSLGTLTLGSQSVSSETRNYSEKLAKSTNNLDWIIKLFQYKGHIPYKLGPDYAQILKSLANYKSVKGIEEYIIKTANGLSACIMKSDSKPDKERSLQAADPFINNATAAHLVASHFDKLKELTSNLKLLSLKEQIKSIDSNDFEDLSSIMESLYLGKIKIIDKDCKNAKILLSTEYRFDKVSLVDASIWFFLTLLEFYKSSFDKFKQIDSCIANIIEHDIILRADVDIKHLCESIEKSRGWKNWVLPWYKYIVEKSPSRDIRLYAGKVEWRIIAELLLLEEPRAVNESLDANLQIRYSGAHSYSLLPHDNPIKRLTRVKFSKIDGMYSCFVFASNVGLALDHLEHIHKLPKEKLVEVADYLVELKENNILTNMPYPQLTVFYLSFVSLYGNGNGTLCMNYARAFAKIPQTLELLDVIGKATIKAGVFCRKSFDRYLFENHNWDKAVEEHYHYLISSIAIVNCDKMTTDLVEYIGTDFHKVNLAFESWTSLCVDCTLDKIPRQLNGYLEFIDEQLREKVIEPADRLKLAIINSLLYNKASTVSHKDFVHYQLENLSLLELYLEEPVFSDLARMRQKYQNYNIDKLASFLYFEQLVSMYFSGLIRMNPEEAFRRLLTKDSFSAVLKEFIRENFRNYQFPIALEHLQRLEREIYKYNPEITMKLQINKMSKMTLLKAAYLALCDPFVDPRLVFVKHLFNAQLLNKSLA